MKPFGKPYRVPSGSSSRPSRGPILAGGKGQRRRPPYASTTARAGRSEALVSIGRGTWLANRFGMNTSKRDPKKSPDQPSSNDASNDEKEQPNPGDPGAPLIEPRTPQPPFPQGVPLADEPPVGY